MILRYDTTGNQHMICPVRERNIDADHRQAPDTSEYRRLGWMGHCVSTSSQAVKK
jgi:hypothetical protein